MVWSDLHVVNSTRYRVRIDGDTLHYGCSFRSRHIDAGPGDRGLSTLKPDTGFLGVEKGVGCTYRFVVQSQQGAVVGQFTVDIRVPASGDNTYEAKWTSAQPDVRLFLEHKGKGGTENAHVHVLTLSHNGPERISHNTADGTLQFFEKVPVVGLGVAAGHSAAGSKHQAERAAIAGGVATAGLLVGAGGTALAAAAGASAAASAAAGGAVSHALGDLAERGINSAVDVRSRTSAGTFTDFDAGRFVAGAAIGAVGGAAGAQGAATFKASNPGLALTGSAAEKFGKTKVAAVAASEAAKLRPNHVMNGADTYRRYANKDTCCCRDAESHGFESIERSVHFAKARNYAGFAFRDGEVWYKTPSAAELLDGMHDRQGCTVVILR